MRVNLNDIKAMAECPAYYQFLKKSVRKPISKQVYTAESTIKMCYRQASKTLHKCTWRRIITHVDREVFRDVDISNKEEVDIARKTSEHVLIFLRRWYHEIYLPESGLGYVDLPVASQLGNHIVWTTIPIIKLTEKPVIVYIDNIVTSTPQMYNDLSLRSLLWLTMNALDNEIVGVEHLTIKSSGGFQSTYLELNRGDSARVTKALKQILSMIERNYSFPSVTEKCTNCSFQRGCMI